MSYKSKIHINFIFLLFTRFKMTFFLTKYFQKQMFVTDFSHAFTYMSGGSFKQLKITEY